MMLMSQYSEGTKRKKRIRESEEGYVGSMSKRDDKFIKYGTFLGG